MSHCLRLILYGLLLHWARAAPSSAELISNTLMSPGYAEEVMRQAKAAEVSNFMDVQVDPCDDFYKFACGKWARLNKATGTDITTGLFERLSDGFDRKVKQMLNSKEDELNTNEDEYVKAFYRSCLRVEEIDDDYRARLKDLIDEFGSMPVLEGDNWQESSFDWLETVSRITYRYGIGIILGTEVTKDVANNKVNVVFIGGQSFPLESRGMYLDTQTLGYRRNYRTIIARKLQIFLGLEKDLAVATAKKILDFEIQLARGLTNEADGLDLTDLLDLTTVAAMQQKYAPSLNVERLVNITLGQQIKDPVYEFNPPYQQNLIKVLERTPNSTVANYIFYRLISEFAVEPGKTLAKRMKGCLASTKKYFSKNLDNMIYRRYNNNATIADVELIWDELKSTFKQKLESDQSLNWIQNETRNLAIEKLEAMTLQVNSYADEDLAEEFEGLYQSDSFLENIRRTFIKSAQLSRDQLHKPAKPLDASEMLSFTPANVLVENTIKVPVSLLQPYYIWAAIYPNAIKFGNLASLIAHELMHGFDDSGRKFDAKGNINDWWDEQSTQNFVQRQRCFTEQYSNYSYNGIPLPESNAQSENIADNGGVRLAFAAYRSWQEEQESSVEGRERLHSEKLPTLNYTSLQLFFISYAQIWCNDVHPAARNLQVATDQHMPGEYRVIGPLSNFPEFASEFQCRLGTRMNPPKKCQIY